MKKQTLSLIVMAILFTQSNIQSMNIDALLDELAKSAQKDALIIACQTNNIAQAQELIAAGVDVNCTKPPMGITPLMITAFNGYGELTRLLLEKGANPHKECKTPRRETALLLAIVSEQQETKNLLLDAMPIDSEETCPLCLAQTKDIAPAELQITTCCAKPICEGCAQVLKNGGEIQNHCPLCFSQPLVTTTR